MKKSKINEIIRDEIDSLLFEACGCGPEPQGQDSSSMEIVTSPTIPWMGQNTDPMLYEPPAEEIGRVEALDRVEKISQMTTCPVTGHALQHLVDSLRSAEGEEEEVIISSPDNTDISSLLGMDYETGPGG